MIRRPPRSPLFPSPTLSRSSAGEASAAATAGTTTDATRPENPATQGPGGLAGENDPGAVARALGGRVLGDRKSTRLNSSHANISYAVFCLKKKNKAQNFTDR